MWFLSWWQWLRIAADKEVTKPRMHCGLVEDLTMTWLTVTVYVWHKWPRICSVIRNHKTVLSLLMICHWVYNKSNTTDGMSPLQNLLCDLLFSIFSFLCSFGDDCSSFYLCSVGHCILCPSSIYVFWLPFWYLQTFTGLHSNCSFCRYWWICWPSLFKPSVPFSPIFNASFWYYGFIVFKYIWILTILTVLVQFKSSQT